jgi:hypothetical protein
MSCTGVGTPSPRAAKSSLGPPLRIASIHHMFPWLVLSGMLHGRVYGLPLRFSELSIYYHSFRSWDGTPRLLCVYYDNVDVAQPTAYSDCSGLIVEVLWELSGEFSGSRETPMRYQDSTLVTGTSHIRWESFGTPMKNQHTTIVLGSSCRRRWFWVLMWGSFFLGCDLRPAWCKHMGLGDPGLVSSSGNQSVSEPTRKGNALWGIPHVLFLGVLHCRISGLFLMFGMVGLVVLKVIDYAINGMFRHGSQ